MRGGRDLRDIERRTVRISGAVQGVGFRPYLFRLAREEAVTGEVRNDAAGVFLDVEGRPRQLDRFLRRLIRDAPPLARIRSVKTAPATPLGRPGFSIAVSDAEGSLKAEITPDAATCADCLGEIFDPADRRYRYPFTNCTQCGPRYTILKTPPYDRANTTMARFAMCKDCATEYADPASRRFHAQPNACAACGPRLEFCDADGRRIALSEAALSRAVDAISAGRIVAVKGLGGFHLICDARNDDVVAALRTRKARPCKPFAVMVERLEDVEAVCDMSDAERVLLTGVEAPIVLLRKRLDMQLSHLLAPGNPYLGAMLAYTPLHRLLISDLGFPIVATSGNRASEPIAKNDEEAFERLSGVADAFLTHDRPIGSAADDSVARVVSGRAMLLRRSRGYAPAPCAMLDAGHPIVALGGHLKNTVARAEDGVAIVSPHIGDLETIETRASFESAANNALNNENVERLVVVADAHPDYASTRRAKSSGARIVQIQHHAAHIYACMAEHGVDEPVLGVAWDGAGYGEDGTIWGGEFLLVDGGRWLRAAHFGRFPLPGGDAAAREPARAAIGLLFAAGRTVDPQIAETLGWTRRRADMLYEMCRRGINAPLTSSAGRLFDGVAALLGLCSRNTFEGEAAMAVEFAAEKSNTEDAYIHDLGESTDGRAMEINWRPMLEGVVQDVCAGKQTGVIARKLHNGLADIIVNVASASGRRRVVLGGGCFQNRLLTEITVTRLELNGFEPFWPQLYPPNDGGLSLGQLHGATLALRAEAEGEA